MNKVTSTEPQKKQTIWYTDALRDKVKAWPKIVRGDIGEELNKVEYGGEPRDFKPMPSIGAGVNEIRVSDEGDQYRLIYVAKFEEAIYVIHINHQKENTTDKQT